MARTQRSKSRAIARLERDLSRINEARDVAPRVPQHKSILRQSHVITSRERRMPRKVNVGDDDDDEDALLRSSTVSKKRRTKHQDTKGLLLILERAASVLEELAGMQDLSKLLKDCRPQDKEDIQGMQTRCLALLGLMKSLNGLELNSNVSAKDSESFNTLYTYRTSLKSLMILVPIESFTTNNRYKLSKIFANIRCKGMLNPLMSALPGWKSAAEPHPRLLDSEEWLELVKNFSKFHNYDFQKYRFDNRHKKAPGTFYASHAEPKLLLWFCCYLVKNLTGKDQSFEKDIGDIWLLRNLEEKPEVVLSLSDLPCRPCKAFIGFIEKYAQIRVHIRLAPNLGRIVPRKNKHKAKEYVIGEDAIYDFTLDEEDVNEDRHAYCCQQCPDNTQPISPITDEEAAALEEVKKSQIFQIAVHSRLRTLEPLSPESLQDVDDRVEEAARQRGMASEDVRRNPKKHIKSASSIPAQFAQYLFNGNVNANTNSIAPLQGGTTPSHTFNTITISSDEDSEEQSTPSRKPSKPSRSYKSSASLVRPSNPTYIPESSISISKCASASTSALALAHSRRATRSKAPLTPSSYLSNIFAWEEARKKVKKAAREATRRKV